MDSNIPSEMAGSLADDWREKARRRSRHRVRTGDREHTVLEMTANGFVIEADGRPPLRGYTDIFLGDERVLHGLVICTWAREGLVGYEFKHDTTAAAQVRADHVPAVHVGLLAGPT